MATIQKPKIHTCITREAYLQAITDMRNPAATPDALVEKFTKLEKKAGDCPECSQRIGYLRFWKNTALRNP